jgi:hypothetical protein
MKTYKVSVERYFYQTSSVQIAAESPDAAIEKAQSSIDNGELTDHNIDWRDAEKIYEPGSFMTTGDVE